MPDVSANEGNFWHIPDCTIPAAGFREALLRDQALSRFHASSTLMATAADAGKQCRLRVRWARKRDRPNGPLIVIDDCTHAYPVANRELLWKIGTWIA